MPPRRKPVARRVSKAPEPRRRLTGEEARTRIMDAALAHLRTDGVHAVTLAGQYDDVGQLFASADGYAVRLQAVAESYLESDGLIEVRTDGIQDSIKGLAEDREQLDAHLVVYEERLRWQFNALDQLVSELTATSEFLAQQLALLPSFETLSS